MRSIWSRLKDPYFDELMGALEVLFTVLVLAFIVLLFIALG